MQNIRKSLKTSEEVSIGAIELKQSLGMQMILWAFQCVHWNTLMSSISPTTKALLYTFELTHPVKICEIEYPEFRPPKENLKGRQKEVLTWLPPPFPSQPAGGRSLCPQFSAHFLFKISLSLILVFN